MLRKVYMIERDRRAAAFSVITMYGFILSIWGRPLCGGMQTIRRGRRDSEVS